MYDGCVEAAGTNILQAGCSMVWPQEKQQPLHGNLPNTGRSQLYVWSGACSSQENGSPVENESSRMVDETGETQIAPTSETHAPQCSTDMKSVMLGRSRAEMSN
jgi:hypothetical protein